MNASHHMISIPDKTVDSPAMSVTTLATEAVRAAFLQACEANLPVVVADGNELVEIGPDGRRTVLKQLAPSRQPTRRTFTID